MWGVSRLSLSSADSDYGKNIYGSMDLAQNCCGFGGCSRCTHPWELVKHNELRHAQRKRNIVTKHFCVKTLKIPVYTNLFIWIKSISFILLAKQPCSASPESWRPVRHLLLITAICGNFAAVVLVSNLRKNCMHLPHHNKFKSSTYFKYMKSVLHSANFDAFAVKISFINFPPYPP